MATWLLKHQLFFVYPQPFELNALQSIALSLIRDAIFLPQNKFDSDYYSDFLHGCCIGYSL